MYHRLSFVIARYRPAVIAAAGILFLSLFTAAAWGNKIDAPVKKLEDLSSAFRQVSKKVSPAVVYISTEYQAEPIPEQYEELFNNEFFRRFFGVPDQRQRRRQGLGSGFIVDSDGHILTNAHVVKNADRITVTLKDNREFDATVIGTDAKSDVAVIKIEGNNLPTAELGDSSRAEVGDWVIAVGTPYGLSHSVTAGIISAEGRANIGIVDYEDFFQTDAAINPGNSGGPLVNIHGQVIGINTAIFSRSGGYQGIGFAIPVNMVKGIMDSLIKHGRMIRGWLGVMIQPVTKDLADSFGLDNASGALVGDILPDSPAQKAGIQRGDVIIGMDGKPIDSPTILKNAVAQTPVGSKASVTVIRSGKKKKLTVTIQELKDEQSLAKNSQQPKDTRPHFGLNVQALTPEIISQLGYEDEKGVIVGGVKPDSPAAEAGIQRGDLIQKIDQQPIASVRDYENAITGKDKVLMLIKRKGNTFYTVVGQAK